MSRVEEMRAAFSRFEGSGLTLKAFGEREGIPYTTLQYWRRKLRGGGGAKAETEKVDLQPVRVVAEPTENRSVPVVGVWLPNGVSLEVPPGVGESELLRLVGVLSRC